MSDYKLKGWYRVLLRGITLGIYKGLDHNSYALAMRDNRLARIDGEVLGAAFRQAELIADDEAKHGPARRAKLAEQNAEQLEVREAGRQKGRENRANYFGVTMAQLEIIEENEAR